MWRREIHRDFFWTGLFVGLVLGGVIGVFLGTETGRRTRDRLEKAALEVRSRLNGTAESETPSVESPDVSEEI